jgi:arylsulfatase
VLASRKHFNWNLYNINEDFFESHDLAKEKPETLARLKELWLAEAGRNNVLPLNLSPAASGPPCCSGRA